MAATALTLPEVARELGLHRATVNEMVLRGRLQAKRVGAHWFVDREVFQAFALAYQKPKHATLHYGFANAVESTLAAVLEPLVDFGGATAAELDELVDLHIGNIRKYLCIAEARGFAVRADNGQWSISTTGSQWLRSAQPSVV